MHINHMRIRGKIISSRYDIINYYWPFLKLMLSVYNLQKCFKQMIFDNHSLKSTILSWNEVEGPLLQTFFLSKIMTCK